MFGSELCVIPVDVGEVDTPAPTLNAGSDDGQLRHLSQQQQQTLKLEGMDEGRTNGFCYCLTLGRQRL